MASWVQNMGLSKGSHLVEGSTLMPKWEDRSGIAIAENNINLLPKNVAQDVQQQIKRQRKKKNCDLMVLCEQLAEIKSK